MTPETGLNSLGNSAEIHFFIFALFSLIILKLKLTLMSAFAAFFMSWIRSLA
jgi:hypothetical protein